MGQITTADATKLDGFLVRVSSAQTSLIQAIRANEPLRAAFAEAEAKMMMNVNLNDEMTYKLVQLLLQLSEDEQEDTGFVN
jgi:hypothetical protein